MTRSRLSSVGSQRGRKHRAVGSVHLVPTVHRKWQTPLANDEVNAVHTDLSWWLLFQSSGKNVKATPKYRTTRGAVVDAFPTGVAAAAPLETRTPALSRISAGSTITPYQTNADTNEVTSIRNPVQSAKDSVLFVEAPTSASTSEVTMEVGRTKTASGSSVSGNVEGSSD
ncbi:hypothetical protein MRX96_026604 [Rhipicephalus microplus]